MRALFDVNLLIALFDPDHLFHDNAHDWWRDHREQGWASCTITENGLLRILSLPKYSPDRPFTPLDILDRLREFTRQTDHRFISESPSLRDDGLFQLGASIRSAELTDVFLLGLAVKHHLRLVTFDRGVSTEHVKHARPEHLVVLS